MSPPSLHENRSCQIKPQQNLLFEFVSDPTPSCKAIVTSRRRMDVDARIIGLEKLDQDAALEYLEALELDRSLATESVDVAICLNALASAEQLFGDYMAAEEYCREALHMARALGYVEGVASYTGNLVELALDGKDWPTGRPRCVGPCAYPRS